VSHREGQVRRRLSRAARPATGQDDDSGLAERGHGPVVAVTGAAQGLGHALTARLAASDRIGRVVAIDDHRGDVTGVTWRVVDVRDPALAGRLTGVDVVVHTDVDLAPDTDARARLMWQKSRTVTDGLTALETYRLIAESMREVITKPMTKGAASAAVTKLMPTGQLKDCPACKSTHIYEQPFRLGALPGGVRLRAGETGLLLEPMSKRGPIPTKSTNPHGLVHRYLRFLGPATPSEVAKWLDTSTANVREIWPDDLAEVTVDGRRSWLPVDYVDELVNVDPVNVVRLLPAMDPFLQARDRDLLVPDRAEQKALWQILGNPGALLVDGHIGGMWRSRLVGRKKLEVTVTSFDVDVDPALRDEVQAEADRIAEVRGVPAAVVRFA